LTALLALLLALLVLPSLAVAADYPGAIAGRLVNGTAGAAVPAGTEARLLVYRGQELLGEKRATTDASGAFAFESLIADGALTYFVAASHAGAVYRSAAIALTPEQPIREVEVRVYEATGTDPGLRVDLAVLILRGVDPTRQEIRASEIARLVNPSDRAFVPGRDGATGPSALARFGLPDGLTSFAPTVGLDRSLLAQVDRGFASFAPILPGSSEVGYEYAFSYAESAAFEKSLPYGASLLYVLTTEDGPSVSSAVLAPGEPFTFQGTRYRMWSARDLPPGSRVTAVLRDLPARPLGSAALDFLVSPTFLPPALAALLAASLAWRLWRPARQGVGQAAVTEVAGE
jgi:hypothetical protein